MPRHITFRIAAPQHSVTVRRHVSETRSSHNYQLPGYPSILEIRHAHSAVGANLATWKCFHAFESSPRPITLARGVHTSLLLHRAAAAGLTSIAKAGLRYEPGNPFWTELIQCLPACAPVPAGILPHPSRYVALTGRRSVHRPDSPGAQWIRPANPV